MSNGSQGERGVVVTLSAVVDGVNQVHKLAWEKLVSKLVGQPVTITDADWAMARQKDQSYCPGHSKVGAAEGASCDTLNSKPLPTASPMVRELIRIFRLGVLKVWWKEEGSALLYPSNPSLLAIRQHLACTPEEIRHHTVFPLSPCHHQFCVSPVSTMPPHRRSLRSLTRGHAQRNIPAHTHTHTHTYTNT